MLLEPEGRNTAAAIALAARLAVSTNPDAILLVLPSDHWIGNATNWRGREGCRGRC
jgi:mannose-1-phosphate guanylyltransferase